MPRQKQGSKKLTDAERHKRFVAMAREVEASEDPKDFDRAFNKVVSSKPGSGTRTAGKRPSTR